MAITMALGVIAKKLRLMGMTITGHMSSSFRPPMPPVPGQVRWFQLSTLMGVMILIGTLIVGIVLATGVVPSYWNHSIANGLNQAQPGSALLAQLGVVKSFHFWLNPLRLVGMSFLFTAITIALTVIIGTLRQQAKLLVGFFYQASS
ncbi:MAG: hypothetical protein U9N80_07865 [Chloroflexota bacterium]|nr:hypothetical protein [Chloroflexota bacterium]